MGLAVVVHFHFSSTRAAAHTNIFDSAAETRGLMALKMVEGDNDIGIHQSLADFSFLDQLPMGNCHIGLVRAFQTIGDNNMAASRKGAEAIFVRRCNVFQRMFAAAYI